MSINRQDEKEEEVEKHFRTQDNEAGIFAVYTVTDKRKKLIIILIKFYTYIQGR